MRKILFTFVLILFIFFFMSGVTWAFALKECAQTALKNSFTLKSYDSEKKQNDFKTAEILAAKNPHISIYGASSYVAPEVSVNIPLPPPAEPINAVAVPNQYHKYSIEISKLITSFGKIEAGAKYNEFNAALIAYQKQVYCDKLIFDTAIAYYTVLSLMESLNTAEAEKEFWQEQLKTAELLFKNGITAKYDLLKIQAGLDRTEERVLAAKSSIQIAKGNLSVLMGVDAYELIGEPENELLFSTFVDEFEIKETAMKCSSSVMLAQTAIAQSDKAIELAKLESSPYLSLSSGYTRNTETFISKNWAWQTSLSLKMPLYDGGERQAKVGYAKELKVQALLTFENVKRILFWDIEKNCISVNELSVREKLAETQIESSKEALRVAKLRYSQGLGTITELSDASASMVSSLGTLERIKYEKQVKLANLSLLKGTIYNDLLGGTE